MYIRRKVFSLLYDETGEERYFSTREILMEDKEEKLFSTLDEEILEQREFGRRQKLARKAQRAAHNAEMHSNKSAKLYWDSKEILNNPKSNVEDLEKVSRNLEKSQRLSNSATREVDDAIKSALKKNPSAPKVSEARKAASDLKGNSRTLSENNMVKKGFKLGKGGKIALGTAAAAGLAYGAKKLYDKKKDKEPMKVKRFSRLDTFQDSVKIVSKKTGEVLTIKRFQSLLDYIGKFIKMIRDWKSKSPYFDIYVGSEQVAELNLLEKSNDELNIVWIETYYGHYGKGYAQAILSELIKFAKSQGYKYLTLEVPGKSPDARHIYEKLGFKEDGILTTSDKDYMWGGLTKMRLNL